MLFESKTEILCKVTKHFFKKKKYIGYSEIMRRIRLSARLWRNGWGGGLGLS